MIGEWLYSLYPWIWWIAWTVLLVLLVLYSLFPRARFFQFTDLIPVWWTDRCYYWGKIALLSVLFWLISVFLMRPQWVDRERVQKNWIDIVIALDVSWSMRADDFTPSRMDVAKEVLEWFVWQLEADRVWLVVFAGKPFVSLPLSYDYPLIQQSIQRVSTESINQNTPGLEWTAVWDALLSSLNLLAVWQEDLDQPDSQDNQREQVVVLLTDWEANRWVDPELVARKAQQEWVKIYTVWIWSIEWWTVEFATAFWTRRQSVWGVDEETLQAIAQQTQWVYRRATDISTFQSIVDQLAELEKTQRDEELELWLYDIGYWLLWWMLIIIIVLLGDRYGFRWYNYDQKTKQRILRGVLLLVVLALRNPDRLQWDVLQSEQSSQWESMIMLDVSKSMDVEDITHGWSKISRIAAAKELIATYLTQHPTMRTGLWIFAWDAITILPMSRNSETVLNMLRWVSWDSLTDQWTNITEAIRLWVQRFISNETVPRQLILITDWWDDPFTLPDDLIASLQEKNITLMHVLVWTQEGGPIPERIDIFGRKDYKEFNGQRVIAQVDVDGYKRSLDTSSINTADKTIEHITALDQIDSIRLWQGWSWSDTTIRLIQYVSMVLARFGMVWYFLLLIDMKQIQQCRYCKQLKDFIRSRSHD